MSNSFAVSCNEGILPNMLFSIHTWKTQDSSHPFGRRLRSIVMIEGYLLSIQEIMEIFGAKIIENQHSSKLHQ